MNDQVRPTTGSTEPATGRLSVALAHPRLLARSVLGGVLMGLANLVPGISGGTMLLASGIYPRFIQAVAELTLLRLRLGSLYVVGLVGGAAVLAILLLAGPVKFLVVEHRWIMYSLFIGLTLGGVPLLWRMVRPAPASTWIGAVAGFLAMAALVFVQRAGTGTEAAASAHLGLMFAAGVAGAAAMILPGISGGYLLLVLGVYVPILAAVDEIKNGLFALDPHALLDPILGVAVPVAAGILVGVVGVSHVLRLLLVRFEKGTLGLLLGLLVGAVLGLWPFQDQVAPQIGQVLGGRTVTAESLAALAAEDYPLVYFQPTPVQALLALLLVGAGLALTLLIGRIGGRGEERAEEA